MKWEENINKFTAYYGQQLMNTSEILVKLGKFLVKFSNIL